MDGAGVGVGKGVGAGAGLGVTYGSRSDGEEISKARSADPRSTSFERNPGPQFWKDTNKVALKTEIKVIASVRFFFVLTSSPPIKPAVDKRLESIFVFFNTKW